MAVSLQSVTRKAKRLRERETASSCSLPSPRHHPSSLCLLIFASNCPVPPTAIFTYKMLPKHGIITRTDMLRCGIPLENRQCEL